MLPLCQLTVVLQVPPRDNIDRVPLGASSASMYPGYSPADHIYGEAASEFGKQMAELKKQGIDLPKDPNGPEYDLAADKKLTQTQIEEIKKQREQEKKGAESGSLVDSADDKADPMEGVEETDVSQLFVIDSNPTPVPPFQANVTTSLTKSKNKANDKAKRRNSNDGDMTGEPAVEKTHKKKVKVSADSTEPIEPVSDDFEKEAEAKHKEREEKRNAKKNKKRKRDSAPSELAAEVPDASVGDSKAEKPKKKSKKDKDRGVTESSKEPATEARTYDGEKVKKRKKKNSEDTPEVVDGGEKKKRKKDKEAT
jgi:hypothetical protein